MLKTIIDSVFYTYRQLVAVVKNLVISTDFLSTLKGVDLFLFAGVCTLSTWSTVRRSPRFCITLLTNSIFLKIELPSLVLEGDIFCLFIGNYNESVILLYCITLF